MACKEYLVNGEWLSEETFKKRLHDGLLEQYKDSGVLGEKKPKAEAKKVKDSIKELLATEDKPKVDEAPVAPKEEVKVETKPIPEAKKPSVKKEVKAEAPTQQEVVTPTKEPKGISIGDEFTDDNRIKHKVIEVNKANNTFKTKDHLGREVNFLINQNKKTGVFYANSFGGGGTPKMIQLPDYVPEVKAKENNRNVKFTEGKPSEEAKKIADKIAYKPSDLHGNWSHARLSNFTEGKEGGFIKKDPNDNFVYYKTLGEKMTDLVNNGLMTQQEAEDINAFIKDKKEQLDKNNKEIDKQIIKDKMKFNGLGSFVIPPVWNLIPQDIRDKFIDRLSNLIVSGKYKLKDAIEIARKGTLDKFLELNIDDKKDLDSLNEFLDNLAQEVQGRISESSINQGVGISKSNNPLFDLAVDGFSEFNKSTKTDKAIIDEAFKYVQDNEEALSNELKALEMDYEKGKRTVLNEDQVARIIVYKKILTDRLNASSLKAYENLNNKSDQQAFEDFVDFEDTFSKHEEELARISLIANYTANTQSAAFRLRQYLIGEDFDIVSQMAKERKARGRELTKDEKQELKDIHIKYVALQKELAELNEKLKEATANENIQNIIDDAKASKGQTGSNTSTESTAEQTGTRGGETGTSSGAAESTENKPTKEESDTPKIVKDKLQLTKGYVLQFIENGIETPEELVEAIRQNLKAAHNIIRTPRQIADAISGYGEKKFKSPDDVEIAYRRAKNILASLSKIEDAQKGKRPFPQTGERLEETQRQKELKKELKEILDSMDISEEEQKQIDLKKLQKYKKNLTTRINSEAKKRQDIFDLQIPSIFNSEKDLKGGDKDFSFYTREQAEDKFGNAVNHDAVVQGAIDSGIYKEAIQSGKISAYDVIRIIDSYGLTPSKEIVALYKEEVKKARKNFKFSPAKVKRIELDEEALRKKIELNDIQEDAKFRVNKILEAQYHWTKKAKNAIFNLLSLPKSSMSGLDLSAPLRQGYVLLSSAPIKALFGDTKALRSQGLALRKMHQFAWYADDFNPKSYEKSFRMYMDRLKQDPSFYLMKECGLDLAEATKQEEEFYGNSFANALPIYGQTLLGGQRTEVSKSGKGLNIPKRSEYAFSGFLNIQRVEAFKDAYNWLSTNPDFDIKTKEGIQTLKGICKYINTMTGRGEVKALPELQQILTRFFFSPKLISSRLRMLAFGFDLPKGLARTYARKQSAYFYASQAALFGLVSTAIALGVGGGDDDETIEERAKRTGSLDEHLIGNRNISFSYNPLSQKFLKLNIGETSIDLTAGIGLFPRALVQTARGRVITSKGIPVILNDKGDDRTLLTPMEDYIINKGGPITGEVFDAMRRMNTPESKGGAEILQGFAPLFLKDVSTNMNNETLEESPSWQKVLGFGLNVASFYGMSINNKDEYENPSKAERRSFRRERLNEGDVFYMSRRKKERLIEAD